MVHDAKRERLRAAKEQRVMRNLQAEIGPPLDADDLRALLPRSAPREDPMVERARWHWGVVTVRGFINLPPTLLRAEWE
jgi:hypothetical protein